jgi:hypothetical protein
VENTKKIYGPIKDQNGWRIRTNDELQALYRNPNIVTTIKVRRMEWAGHLASMSDGRAVEEVFWGKPDGRRKARRSKLRWLDCIESDVKFMEVKRWRKKAEDRPVRAVILKEALVTAACQRRRRYARMSRSIVQTLWAQFVRAERV